MGTWELCPFTVSSGISSHHGHSEIEQSPHAGCAHQTGSQHTGLHHTAQNTLLLLHWSQNLGQHV
jgi:hypothetical protein